MSSDSEKNGCAPYVFVLFLIMAFLGFLYDIFFNQLNNVRWD